MESEEVITRRFCRNQTNQFYSHTAVLPSGTVYHQLAIPLHSYMNWFRNLAASRLLHRFSLPDYASCRCHRKMQVSLQGHTLLTMNQKTLFWTSRVEINWLYPKSLILIFSNIAVASRVPDEDWGCIILMEADIVLTSKSFNLFNWMFSEITFVASVDFVKRSVLGGIWFRKVGSPLH